MSSKVKMTEKQRAVSATYLERFAEEVRQGKVVWFAVTVKYPNSSIAIHTKGAPKRPKGIS